MAKNRSPKTVFLSYTKLDKDFVRRLANDIESYGFTVWLDEWEVRVGDSLIERIEEGIQECQWMIVVLSPAALESQWVRRELRAGLTKEIGSKKIFVLPALCQRVENLPSFLADKFYADFTESYAQGLALIKDRLFAQYKAAVGEEWLLIRNPLPERVRESHNDEDTPDPDPKTGRQWTRRLASPKKEKVEGGVELWFGRTGRLMLRRSGEHVSGDYDWHGLSFAGQIEGHCSKDHITFTWDWRLTSERGRGLFWTTVPNVLFGGWWMDYDDIDEEAIRSGQIVLPYRWEFVNVEGLKFSERRR